MTPLAERLGPVWTRRRFATDPETLARRLIGAMLVRRLEDGMEVGGMIVETEAYLGTEDAAAHSYRGRRTARVESMYARPGTAYVFFTYGMHNCFNVVCGREGQPVAVLVRALEPRLGIEEMRARRGAARRRARPVPDLELASGPARLTQALAIDRSLDGLDLTSDPRLRLYDPSDGRRVRALDVSARVGVGYAGEWATRELRWALAGNPHVSRP